MTNINALCYGTSMTTDTVSRELPVRHKNEPCCGPLQMPHFSTAQTDVLADRLKAIADPTRLGILDLLVQQEEPLCVCDLTPRFPQNQPTISHHLRLLREAGLIAGEKRGVWSYYWATDEGRRYLAAVADLI